MQTDMIVTRLLRCCVPLMHASRWRVLRDAVVSAVSGKALTLTALALGTKRATSLRHRVKCVDRLLANAHLEGERLDVYRALAHAWLGGLPQLLIVVDWSTLTADQKWHWLRASAVVDGRSITRYEEVHARKHLGARKVQRQFIERLAAVLPASERRPIILTDAGFRAPWFRLVAQRGWYWIGRQRNRDFVRKQGGQWIAAKSLHAKARQEAQELGLYEAVRSPLACGFALIKSKRAWRQRKYPSAKVRNNSSMRKIAKRPREPWFELLARVGLPGCLLDRQALPQRMKIEQQFRDTKNLARGQGLSQSMSHGQRRLQALLLIAHVAQLAKRLIGEAAKAKQLELQLMSNNTKNRNTISVLTLATRVIERPDLLREVVNPWAELQTLRRQATWAITQATQCA